MKFILAVFTLKAIMQWVSGKAKKDTLTATGNKAAHPAEVQLR